MRYRIEARIDGALLGLGKAETIEQAKLMQAQFLNHLATLSSEFEASIYNEAGLLIEYRKN